MTGYWCHQRFQVISTPVTQLFSATALNVLQFKAKERQRSHKLQALSKDWRLLWHPRLFGVVWGQRDCLASSHLVIIKKRKHLNRQISYLHYSHEAVGHGSYDSFLSRSNRHWTSGVSRLHGMRQRVRLHAVTFIDLSRVWLGRNAYHQHLRMCLGRSSQPCSQRRRRHL